MATVRITRVLAGGDNLPVLNPVPLEKLTVTSSGTSQAVGAGAPVTPNDVWDVVVTGGNVWIKFDIAPVASAGNDWLLLDGERMQFSALSGHKVAVIDA